MSIEKRLSSLSSSREMFEETTPYYEQYLSNCGYKEKLYHRDPTSPNLITKRKRQRNILWLNPPHSEAQNHSEIKLLMHAQHQNKNKRT